LACAAGEHRPASKDWADVQYEIEIGGRRLQVVVTRTDGGFAVAVDGIIRHVDAARIDAHTLSQLVTSPLADSRDGLKAVPYEHPPTNAAESRAGLKAVPDEHPPTNVAESRADLKAVPYEHPPTKAAESRVGLDAVPHGDADKAQSANVGDGLQAVPSDNAHSHEVSITSDPVSGQLAIHVGAIPVAATLNGRRRWGRRDEGGGAGSGPQRLVAPMPGKVVRVLVKGGDKVAARQPVMVVEAMKMENELRASHEGTVAEIHVREGMSVEAGALLLVIQ